MTTDPNMYFQITQSNVPRLCRTTLTDIVIYPHAAQVSSAPLNPKAVALESKLDKLDGDLAQAEQDILSRLRAPLDRNDPAADMANRLKEQEVSVGDMERERERGETEKVSDRKRKRENK